jgi:hypothetical protein
LLASLKEERDRVSDIAVCGTRRRLWHESWDMKRRLEKFRKKKESRYMNGEDG